MKKLQTRKVINPMMIGKVKIIFFFFNKDG